MEDTPGRPTLGHRFQDAFLRGVEGLLQGLSESAADRLGAGLGRLVGSGFRIRRRVVESNLRQAFPEAEPRWIRGVAARAYVHLGREGVALLRMAGFTPEGLQARTSVEGWAHLEKALAPGRGVLLLSGHLGNWEIGGAALAVRGVPMDAVVKRQNNPLFDLRLNAVRERLGVKVVERHRSTRTLLRSLRKGRVVALLADQNVRQGGVFIEYFGREASTTRGPALLALRTGASLIFVTAHRLPGVPARYRVRIEPLAPPDPALDQEAATRDLLRRYLALLEAEVRRSPEQYLWAHKRWKTRPLEEGEAAHPDELPGNRIPEDR